MMKERGNAQAEEGRENVSATGDLIRIVEK